MWFKKLMGFREEDPDQVRKHIEINDTYLVSKVNQKKYVYGRLEIVSLEKLRKRTPIPATYHTKISVTEVIEDVQNLHRSKENHGALFQVASQFNLLEMASPGIIPEMGVGIYEGDPTQGPACAIACGAGTIYRNYFCPVNGRIGQSRNNQINCLEDMETEFGSHRQPLWNMQNGYLFSSGENLKKIEERIKIPESYDRIKGKLKIGIQWNTEVTLPGTDNLVTQAYCAALPVTYNHTENTDQWESFARLILEATYEATFYTAVQNYANTKNNKLFLTLVGGGVFGNKEEWILDAIGKSLIKFSNSPLDVKIVSHSKTNPKVSNLIDELAF